MEPEGRVRGIPREVLRVGGARVGRGQMDRKRFLSLLTSCGMFAAAPGMLSACGSERNTGSSQANGPLRYLIGEAFLPTWNPYNHARLSNYTMGSPVFNGLTKLSPDLSLEPDLAEEWEQIDDRTFEFRLREGVRFHNGQQFSARDVKASIELVSGFAGEEEMVQSLFWLPHEVEVVDDLTARLRGEEPYGPLLDLLATTYILSAEDVGKGLDALEKAPNGTGPYRLNEDEPNRKSFVPFDGYFADVSRPDELVIEYVADPQTRLNALLSRQAEIIDRVQPDQATAIERRDDVELLAVTASETQSFYFRMDKEPFGSNDRLRRAFAWGVDREGIVELVGGKARLADSHFAPGLNFKESQQPLYTFDPERARAEMEATGVQTPVPFEMLVATGFLPKAQEACELAVENLREVGFDPKLTPLSLAAWSDALQGEAKRGEVFYGSAANIYPDPDIQLVDFVEGAAYDAHTQRIYDLIETGRTTLDEDERARIYAALQQYMWDHLPSLPLIFSDYSQGLRQGLSGYEVPLNFIPSFVSVRLEGAS